MARRIAVVAGVATILAPASAAWAQAPAAAAPCSYDACGLRREGVFFSQRVVAGVNGRVVARQGFAGFRLDSALAGSERALAESRIQRREARVGGLLSLAGTVLGAVAIVDATRDGRRELSNGGTAAVAAGAALTLAGAWRMQIADRALNRAIWWHNRDLPR